MPVGDEPTSHGGPYGRRPDTAAATSERFVTADLASIRWLDLLACDAAPQHHASTTALAGTSTYAWQLDRDMELHSHEAVLFRTFAERAALWLDVGDPQRHFSVHATRLAVRFCSALFDCIEARHPSLGVKANGEER